MKTSEEERNKSPVLSLCRDNKYLKSIEMEIKFENFHKICRFCLRPNVPLYSIFEASGKKWSTASAFDHLGNILDKSLGLEICARDGLPKSACENCTDKLRLCEEFWDQCQSATQVLKTVLVEHLKNVAETKQDVSTEAVDLALGHVDTFSTTIKPENMVHGTAEMKTNPEAQMPIKKRIRKKPEYQHCFICGLKCRYVNRHITIMHSIGRYECDICKAPRQYYARSKGQLYIHMGAKHINKVETEFVCSVCDKNFKNPKKLNNHMAAKHPARRHPCPHCRLIFKSERTLNRHQTIHTGERNYICEECGKSFRQTETLRNHQLRHFPPTVPCPHCDKMFYVKSQLRNHEGIHTGIRSWQCDICSASFVASSGLTAHRNKHKKENVFPTCKVCGEQFNDRLDLRMHVNDHRKSLI